MWPERPHEPWNAFLTALDNAVDTTVRLDCIGGFVLTELYGMDRKTGDLDAVEIAPGSAAQALLEAGHEGSELHKQCGLYLQYVTVATLPYEYGDRLQEAFPGYFRHLRLMVLDPYDVALSKLSRNLQRDRDDVRYLGRVASLDPQILKERYFSELRLYLTGSLAWHDRTLELWIEMIEEDREGSKMT
jgi:Nucleotidyltransferase of unknown function (DUF6036)